MHDRHPCMIETGEPLRLLRGTYLARMCIYRHNWGWVSADRASNLLIFSSTLEPGILKHLLSGGDAPFNRDAIEKDSRANQLAWVEVT